VKECSALSDVSLPTVSVIMPHYSGLNDLGRCLTALEAQTYPRDLVEIIVADNNSPEGEAAVAKVVRGRAKLLVITEKGAGPARNGGAAAASGEVLAFTDADCVPETDWLVEGVRKLNRYDVVGGKMKVLVHDAARVSPTEAFELVFAFDNETYIRKKGFTISANLICTRALFEKMGGFLPAPIAEDIEWCNRAIQMGHTLGYAPSAVVGHPARKNWEDLLKKWRRANSDNFHLTTRRKGGRIRWLMRALLLPISALAHSPKVIFSRNVNGVRQKLSALETLYRLRMWRFGNSMRLYFKK
jgi:cellulose synthase/poly-beta-1,6-N-acetylglucosamine synthase-like glycosyltransferase